ncbi:MAG TPA: hypothetical protein VMN57_13410, partial [Anaerolineales bacterium]|nr:hypothetical protein [Anaerolineales bacterium]
AVTFTIVDEVLIDIGQLRHVAYGFLIIAIFLWMRRGLLPTAATLWRRMRGLEIQGDSRSSDPAADRHPLSTD